MWDYHDFFCYPDPDPRLMKWIRIQIRPNEVNPGGSGFETLIILMYIVLWWIESVVRAHNLFILACCSQCLMLIVLWIYLRNPLPSVVPMMVPSRNHKNFNNSLNKRYISFIKTELNIWFYLNNSQGLQANINKYQFHVYYNGFGNWQGAI